MWRYLEGFRHNALHFSCNTAKQRVENLESRNFSAQHRMENLGVALLCPFMPQQFPQTNKTNSSALKRIKMSTVWYS